MQDKIKLRLLFSACSLDSSSNAAFPLSPIKSCRMSSRAARALRGFLEPWVRRDGRTERLCSATAEVSLQSDRSSIKLGSQRRLGVILSATTGGQRFRGKSDEGSHGCAGLAEDPEVLLTLGWGAVPTGRGSVSRRGRRLIPSESC